MMSIKKLVGEIQDGFGNKWRKKVERKCGRSYVVPEEYVFPLELDEDRGWADLPPELLVDIIGRVEASETLWPGLRDVVCCAAVCRLWRATTKEVVRTVEQCGVLTFPMSLKQPGPRGFPIQCFIKRDLATSTYRLYLGLSPALTGDASKLLLVAKKIRRSTRMEFLISLVANDFSRSSNTIVGKLRSNFLGTKFVVYDSQPPSNLIAQSKRKVNNSKVATVCYELNVLRTRGPRRIQSTMHCIPFSAIQENGTAPTPDTFGNWLEHKSSPLPDSKGKYQKYSSNAVSDPLERPLKTGDPLVLKNKVPRWHEQLQCWCLNFKGRVTVASVKNFQLVSSVSPSQNVAAEEQEKVMLQFGKIANDVFTMDYRYPLSAFQAFAICLSSFDTKPACE